MNQRLPSIRRRLGNALLVWSLAWSLAVSAAVWLAADREVAELLDDQLQASAAVLGSLLHEGVGPAAAGPADASIADLQARGADDDAPRFAWQVVTPDGRVSLRSASAPPVPLRAVPASGFGNEAAWRVFGRPLPTQGSMLYVAQTRQERREAQLEVAISAILSALAVGLLGHLWLRARVRHELQPLQTLSDRLAAHDPLKAGAELGTPERRELAPMHEALEALSQRLALRIAREQAFSAHAAHALRTPLAGIDAQLAVALREAAPELQPRLRRARDAAGRLQGVVSSLLALFRAPVEPQRRTVDLAALVRNLPAPELRVRRAEGVVQADADLLAAALLNLLDNARRHGAAEVSLSVPVPGTVRVQDDGPGLPPAQRAELQRALLAQDHARMPGLGLVLADAVGRAHGGGLDLPDVPHGFAVDLRLVPHL